VVVVDDADKFVTEHRDKLEEWVNVGRAQRLLVLNVRTWLKTTRLAKGVEEHGLAIDCGIPSRGGEVAKFNRDLRKWLTARATQVHGVKLESAACDRLIELLPTSPGMLDLEVAKLALLATDGRIATPLVEANVGDWRTRQAWDMIDLMASGHAAEALRQLDKLLSGGEEPIGVLAQIASTLRRFGTAAQLIEQWELAGRRVDLEQAVKQAGFLPFKQKEAVQQLRNIGRVRARQIPQWLLEIDFASKDYHSSRAMQRFELERLIIRLSPQARPETASAS
jgi:DNA polymerase-3 subunit delta